MHEFIGLSCKSKFFLSKLRMFHHFNIPLPKNRRDMENGKENTRRYINPLTDFGFKKIFGDEEIMREFLNDLIEPESPIVQVTFIDKEMQPETKYERGVIYDMRCRLSSGEEIIVEMQNRGQDYFTDRINYYLDLTVTL